VTDACPDIDIAGPDLPTVLTALGQELAHAAELLRRYERAVLTHTDVSGAKVGVSELQLVDLVIQILEELGPFSRGLAGCAQEGDAIPSDLIERLRLDQLRVHLGGRAPRRAPHSGGHIDFF